MGDGDRLLRLLQNNEMQQKELAEKIDMDPAVLNRVIKNRRPLRSDELSSIADVFGVTTDSLLGRPEDLGKRISKEEMEARELARKIVASPEIRKLIEDIVSAFEKRA